MLTSLQSSRGDFQSSYCGQDAHHGGPHRPHRQVSELQRRLLESFAFHLSLPVIFFSVMIWKDQRPRWI
jgi:hypothetical protein